MEGMIARMVNEHIAESIRVKQVFLEDESRMAQLSRVAAMCIDVYRHENKILIAGNGGSAADAQHFAGEMVSRFYFDRPGLPAIALTTDTSILTAIGNDYGYERLFSRQVEAHGRPGDLFVGISTSGNSPNVLLAAEIARKLGLKVVGLTGDGGGKLAGLCDECICVPSKSTPRIQESHLILEHILCACVEEALFGNGRKY
jgi:D-sedoheptulose 7-phosphate isomerase